VLVHLPVTVLPVVELAGGDLQPADQPPRGDRGLFAPLPDEIDDLIPNVVRDPLLI
jgi:hypothetical protein